MTLRLAALAQDRGDWVIAAAIGVCILALYNANGREIPSYDSQPTKYAARELLLRGTLSLNHIVGRTPELAQRSAFVETANGRYRSAYSPVPAVIAAGVAWPLWKTGLVDIRAPRAPGLMAALTSSLLVAIAVALVYLTARTQLSRRRAALVACSIGLGTGLWSTASQTLWQHETAIFGLALAVWAWMTIERAPWTRPALLGLGLGLAGGSRLQLAPAVLVCLAGVAAAAGWRRALAATFTTSVVVVPVLVTNHLWFGTVLGAAPMLEALHESVHKTSRSFALQLDGFAGLLVSPNRGLLIFSPIVAVAALGFPAAIRTGWRSPHPWILCAAGAQFVLYGLYSVWWGGHTSGPRYVLDVLPLLVPPALFGVATLRTPARTTLASLALAWSVAVAALGAFNYPHGRWNSDPVDVDRAHDRLWNWRDSQIRRTWNAGPSPQNFTLFTRDVRTAQ
jgi:hypothetical protein